MSQFPSTTAKEKACELLRLLNDMTIYDIYETLDVVQFKLKGFSSKQVYKSADIDQPVINNQVDCRLNLGCTLQEVCLSNHVL